MKEIKGGVCAAKGYAAAGVHCGIRKNKSKYDLAYIQSETRAAAACVYTQNLVKGAPLLVTKQHVADGYARAILCNSGNANTCNADGVDVAEQMCRLVEKTFGVASDDVIVASTGVIGQPLPIEPIASGMPLLADALSPAHGDDAAAAILTTDTADKQYAVTFRLGGVDCTLGGMAKGSGMIHPNMATMLVFLTCDAAISPALLQQALREVVPDTFNMISIDGDTSTNDMVALLSNGMAGNPPVETRGEDYETFKAALFAVTDHLSRRIAADGEGATRLLLCEVTGAADRDAARTVAKSVVCSSLVKAAIYGRDANWGRVLCAIGYSGVDTDVAKIGVRLASTAGEIEVCRDGAGVAFSEERALEILSEDEIRVLVSLGDGTAAATAYGCDLTCEYVKINSDYRS